MEGEKVTAEVETKQVLEWMGYRPSEGKLVYGFSSVVKVDGTEVARKDCSGACDLPIEELEERAPGLLEQLVEAIAASRTAHLAMLAEAAAKAENTPE